MSGSKHSGTLEKLRSFLSTETRKSLFFCYVFAKTSPSDISTKLKVPISTVDMVTNTLRLMELLKGAQGQDKSKNYYKINTELWAMENLKSMGMDFIDEKQKKELFEILDDQKFMAISYVMTDPDFATKLYEDPLKMGDDLIVYKLMRLFKKASLVSDLPSYVMMSVLFFPSFAQLKENISTEQGAARILRYFDKAIKRHPFLLLALEELSVDDLREYNVKRASLARIMERLFEKELQLLSTQKAEDEVEEPKEEDVEAEETAEEEAEERPEQEKKPKKKPKKKAEKAVEKPEEESEEAEEAEPEAPEEKDEEKAETEASEK